MGPDKIWLPFVRLHRADKGKHPLCPIFEVRLYHENFVITRHSFIYGIVYMNTHVLEIYPLI